MTKQISERDKYIKEMREYWQATRGSGIKGTKALEPDNFEEIIGKYYDEHIKHKAI